MANPITKAVITRKYVVKTADDGLALVFGNASDAVDGWWEFQFVPDVNFIGQFAVGARSGVREAGDGNDDVPFIAVPYHNMTAPTALTFDPVTAPAIIYVPSGALFVGLTTACSAGTCTIYSRPLSGPVQF